MKFSPSYMMRRKKTAIDGYLCFAQGIQFLVKVLGLFGLYNNNNNNNKTLVHPIQI